MKRECYKNAIEVLDDDGRVYQVQHFVTIIDGQEGASFYRLADGTPVKKISGDCFEIGFIDKVRTKRR
jgi:hypothetical protein